MRGAKEPQKKKGANPAHVGAVVLFSWAPSSWHGGSGLSESSGGSVRGCWAPPAAAVGVGRGEERGLAAELEDASPWMGGCPEVIYV